MEILKVLKQLKALYTNIVKHCLHVWRQDKTGQEVDTGISQIIVGVVASSKEVTRHQKRFGISSFIYRARRPFHPGRLYDVFLEPHFFFHGSMKEEAEEIEKLGLETRQRNAAAKHSKRWQHNVCEKLSIFSLLLKVLSNFQQTYKYSESTQFQGEADGWADAE